MLEHVSDEGDYVEAYDGGQLDQLEMPRLDRGSADQISDRHPHELSTA